MSASGTLSPAQRAIALSRTPRTQRHRRERTRERAESHSSTDQQGRPGGSNSQCPLDSELLRLAGDGESEQGQQVVMYDSSSDESSDDGEEDHGVMLMSTKHRKPMRKTYNGRERQIRQRDEMRELALRGTGDRETSLVPTMKRRKRTRIMPTCGMLQLTHSPAVHKNSSSEDVPRSLYDLRSDPITQTQFEPSRDSSEETATPQPLTNPQPETHPSGGEMFPVTTIGKWIAASFKQASRAARPAKRPCAGMISAKKDDGSSFSLDTVDGELLSSASTDPGRLHLCRQRPSDSMDENETPIQKRRRKNSQTKNKTPSEKSTLQPYLALSSSKSMSAPKLATDSFSLSGWSISPPDSKNSSSNSTPKESEEMAEASIPERANKPAVLESLGKSREASGVGYESSLHSTAVRGFVESPISPGEPEILSPKSSGKPDGVKVGEEPEPSKSENDLDLGLPWLELISGPIPSEMASPPPPLKRDASIPSFAPGPARSHATGKASPGSGVSIPRSLTHNRTHASNTPNTRISNNLEGPSSLMDEESQLLSESEVPKTDSESEEDSKIDPAEPAKPLIKLFQPYDFSKIPRRRVSLTVLGKPPTSTPSSMKPPPNGPTPPMMITTPQPQDRRRIQTCNAPWKSYFSTLDTMIQVPASVAPKRSRVHLPLPRPEIFMNVAQLDFSSQRRAETLRASFRIPTKLPGSAPGRVLSQVVRGGMSITRYGPPGMEEADGGGGGGNSRRGVGSVGGGGGVNICESERETNPKVVAARSGFSQVREAWV